MRVERVRYFEAAGRLGSLRAAANELGISQPTLSAQLQLLEEELDLVLLTRTARGVTPTSAGTALLGRARDLIAAEEALKQDAIGISGLKHGTVRIGCITIAIRALLWKVIARLVNEHPGLTFTVREGPSTSIEEQVENGALDIGLVASAHQQSSLSLTRTRLLDTQVLACLPAGHPLADRHVLSISDLYRWPLVVREEGAQLRNLLLSSPQQHNVIFEASTIDTARLMIARGIGVGIDTALGAQTMSPTDHNLIYIPIMDANASLALDLVRRRRGQPSKAVLLVSSLIRDAASRLDVTR